MIQSSLDALGTFTMMIGDGIGLTKTLVLGITTGAIDDVLDHRSVPLTINFCDVLSSPNDCNQNSIPDECDRDGDGDGMIDDCDPCPADPENDADGDGVCAPADECPDDPEKSVSGLCGCGNSDTIDSDGDDTPDCLDACPSLDDELFGAGCANAIPTASAWGLVTLTLLLLICSKVSFHKRTRTAP